ARERADLTAELGDLRRIRDVAGQVDDAAQVELGDKTAEVVGRGVSGKTGDHKSSGPASKVPKRHSLAIIMRGWTSTLPLPHGSISRAARTTSGRSICFTTARKPSTPRSAFA